MSMDLSSAFSWLKTNQGNIGAGLQGFGAGFGAVSAYNAAQSQQEMYDYQAQLAANHAITLGWQAKDAEARGAQTVQNIQVKTAGVKGDQRAAMAANGIEMSGSGTAADLLTTTDYMGTRDSITAQHNADMQAWAYRNQATDATNNSAMYTFASDSISPIMSAGTSLLTSAGSFSKNLFASSSAKGTNVLSTSGN